MPIENKDAILDVSYATRDEYGTVRRKSTFDITPRGDDWLRSKERGWDEVDEIIEGRLQAIQKLLTVDKKPSETARAYGIEKLIGGNASRFLAYVELNDEYRTLEETHERHANDGRAEFESEVKSIRQQSLTNREKEKKIAELRDSFYNPFITKHTKSAQEARQIHNLILRKAVLDLYSVKNNTTELNLPLVTLSFSPMLNEAKERFARQSEGTEQFKQRKPIDSFIEDLTTYLTNTQDEVLFARYDYRETPGLIAKRKDCEVLDTLLTCALDSKSLTLSQETALQLEKLGKAFFTFLKRRSTSLAFNLNEQEKYPHLSLLYDIYSAAFYRGRPSILEKVDRIIDPNFADRLNSKIVRQEVQSCADFFVENTMNITTKVVIKDPQILTLKPAQLDIANKLPQEIRNFVTRDEYRFVAALAALKGFFAQGKDIIVRPSRSFTILDQHFVEAFIRSGTRKGFREQDEETGQFLSAVAMVSGIYAQSGIENDLSHILFSQKGREIFMYPVDQILGRTKIPDVKDRKGTPNVNLAIQMLKKYSTENAGLEKTIAERELLFEYLRLFWQESDTEYERYEKENIFLWNELLDNPVWFVSPRGDSYTQLDDPELAEQAIDAVTFRIAKQYPREHRVDLRIRGINQLVTVWLDTHRNLSGSMHQVLALDVRSKQALTNLLLKRLYYITSGKLSKKDEEKTKPGEEFGPSVISKRAHYRILTSTPEHPITMQSHGAQRHAKEILDIYKIDIIQEIKRRRAIGTLAPNQFLTFVKEVSLIQDELLVLPNHLKYDPEAIVIPVD